MKKMLKQFFVIALSICLPLSTLAGCQKEGQSSSHQTESQTSSLPAENIETIDFYGFQQNPSNTFFQWQQDYFAETIGVHVNIIPGDSEKLQTMLSAGNLPDVGRYSVNGNLSQVIKGGHLTDLTPYESQIPNYTEKWPESVQFSKDYQSDGTGKLYGLFGQLGTYNPYFLDTGSYAVKIRWDIYEKIGKPEVTDMYSLLDVCLKMKEFYPQTSDGLETYMTGLFPETDSSTMRHAQIYFAVTGIMSNYSGLNSFVVYDLVNEKSESIFEKNGSYYQALKWLATANRMGLIDPDSMTQTYDITQAKLKDSEQYFASFATNYVEGFNTDANNNASDPKGFMPLIWDGQKAVVGEKQTTLGGGYLTSISSSTEKLDACLKFCNLLYDKDALMVMYGGPKGELWDIVDGKYTLTEAADNLRSTGSHTFYTGEESGDWWGAWGLCAATSPSKYPNATLRVTDSLEYVEKGISENKIYDMYEGFYGKRRPIEVWEEKDAICYQPSWTALLETMPANLEDIKNNAKGVVTEYSWKIVMTSANDSKAEQMFNEMVEQCETLGVQEVVDWGKSQIEAAQEKVQKYENMK